jgi:hypothetical protein
VSEDPLGDVSTLLPSFLTRKTVMDAVVDADVQGSGQLVVTGYSCARNVLALRWRWVRATHHVPSSRDAGVLARSAREGLLDGNFVAV